MFCSKCGAENDDGARFCAKCGQALAVPPPVEPVAPPVTTMRNGTVGAAVTTANASPTGKTPWVAVVLSFLITGLGQLYNNDYKKGAVMFIGAVLGVIFTAGIATVAFWIWGMVDGYLVASGKGKVW